MSARPRRVAWTCGLCALFALSWGCKRDAAPAPAASASAGAPAAPSGAPAATSRCRRLSAFALSAEGAPSPSTEEAPRGDEGEDDDALLPFGVEVGQALPTTFGFAVAGLRGSGRAFLALLGERSRTVELGALHGDAEPPALAVDRERVVVALRTTDAAGFALKLGQLSGAEGGIEWGYERSKLGRTVTGVTLALSGTGGLVVYEGEDKSGSRLFLGRFTPEQLKAPFELGPLAVKDAEAPRVIARPGGYWLSWVRALPEVKRLPTAPKPKAEDPEEQDLLVVGLRVVEVAKLDERGELLGAPLQVGEAKRQVVLFDVAPSASGGLLVAMRADSSTPGAEEGALLLSEVRADGTQVQERIDDDEIGAGPPVLLVDGDADEPTPWLAVTSPSGATRLGPARGSRTLLQTEPLIGHAEVIALGGGRFLTQRARGRDAELALLSCVLEPAPPAPASQK